MMILSHSPHWKAQGSQIKPVIDYLSLKYFVNKLLFFGEFEIQVSYFQNDHWSLTDLFYEYVSILNIFIVTRS
jgi:hypothetical protein